jgi:hypothetical protein
MSIASLSGARSHHFALQVGYFSKEKDSPDDYNIACILTMPPYQRKVGHHHLFCAGASARVQLLTQGTFFVLSRATASF